MPDSIDLRVKQILADGFARARRPRLTIDPEPCEHCHGDGCYECRGTGEAPIRIRELDD